MAPNKIPVSNINNMYKISLKYTVKRFLKIWNFTGKSLAAIHAMDFYVILQISYNFTENSMYFYREIHGSIGYRDFPAKLQWKYVKLHGNPWRPLLPGISQ